MKLALAFGTLLATLALVPATARADEEPAAPTPYESIRTLRRLQEGVAHGNKAAQSAMPSLLATIGSRFLDADPASWRDPRNARAAILFLFSGGKPAVIRTVLGRSTMPRESDRLLKGALAYAEGQDQVARDLLAAIDPRSVPPIVGGQLALVEATLFVASDRVKAGRLLDTARLLLPGSLIEEAALRRQAAIEADAPNLTKYVVLARQYLHRYRTSIYAQNFRQHLGGVAVRLAQAGDPAALAQLDPAIAELTAAEQRTLYLVMSRTAMVRGHTEAARIAAARVAGLGKDTAKDAARAKLYLDAASIVSGDVVKGVEALEAVDAAELSAEDADLRTGALAVARAAQGPVSDAPGAEPGSADDGSAAVLAEARAALTRGGDLLAKTP